ncbi:MAG: hypothetical protein ACJ77A_03600 [Actinomycetota bacterium]
MAKKKSKKRGWSGAPPARPSGASRPPTAGGSRPAPAASATPGGVKTEDGTAPETATVAPSQARPAAKRASARPAPQPTSNRTVRKEEARRQREMLRRKAARQRRMRRYGIIAGGVVAVGVVASLIVISSSGGGLKHVDPRSLPGITEEKAPWQPDTAQLSQRIAKMGLPPLGSEQLAYHIHQNLAVYVNGTLEPVPTGLGAISSNALAEIHTHDNSGTIHVEAGATRHFTLGDVFDVWGVLFTPNQIGAYKNHGDTRIRVFVNGKPYRGDPTQVPLRDKEVIVVTYGTPAQIPNPIPSVFHYGAPPTVAKAKPTPTGSAAASSPSAAPSASPS